MSDPTPAFKAPAIQDSQLKGHKADIFFAAVETTRMPMIVTDPHQPDNPIVFANRAFLEMTGYAMDELVGRNCRFLQGRETDQDTLAAVRQAIAERREFATEILNYRKDGSAFWNALFVSPVHDEQGRLVFFFGSQLDVSRRRDAEQALRQAQKMEAVGQLTGGIAHDFNNLLQVISGHLELMEGLAGSQDIDRELLRRSLAHASGASRKAATLTQQLLAFARRQTLYGRTVNLNTLVTGMIELARRSVGADIELRLALAPDLWNCRLDSTQAESALLNILHNAREALQGRPRRHITLATRNHDLSVADVLTEDYRRLAPGRYVSVALTDTGIGMPPDIQARVLDPFFTTKQEGEGPGLGLSMVYGFVKQSGGAVRIYSELGQGTTIRLYFPASSDEGGKPDAPAPRAGSRQGHHERILVVEDREDVADVARLFLEGAGYRIAIARTGEQALDLLQHEGPFDLLFTDLIMPGGMNGVVLAREAQRRSPHPLKVILTTGYADASLERTDAGGAQFDLLGKPYTRHDLLRLVRIVLDGPTGTG